MNRRSFVAAVPALMPAMAFAQEATPHADPLPETLMTDLIQALFVDRSITKAADLLSPYSDQDAMVMHFVGIIEWLDDRYGDEPIALAPVMLTSDGNKAVALLDIGLPREVYVFLYINTDSSGIIGIRSRWGEF